RRLGAASEAQDDDRGERRHARRGSRRQEPHRGDHEPFQEAQQEEGLATMTKVEWQPMKAAHKRFPPERLGEVVIAHTPIIQPSGCTPGYIILRETEEQYIVHNAEVDEKGAFVGLYWGHYID